MTSSHVVFRLDYYRSASVVVSFATALTPYFDCYQSYPPNFVHLHQSACYKSVQLHNEQTFTHPLSSLYLFKIAIAQAVDINFQFKAFLLKYSINNDFYDMSGRQLVFIFWSMTLIACWRSESLKVDVGRPPLTIQWAIQWASISLELVVSQYKLA